MVKHSPFLMFQPIGSFILIFLFMVVSCKAYTNADYHPGFYNHSKCLYAYQVGGNFSMNTEDGEEVDEELDTDMLSYDPLKTRCSSFGESGKLVFSYKIRQSKDETKNLIKSITVSLGISTSPSEGIWEINQANLTIVRADVDRKRNFQLRVAELYASLNYSFSCYELKLNTIHKKKAHNATGRLPPSATLILRKFQLQPFEELEDVVFSSSFDCSSWISVPGLMGFCLITFMTFVTILGVIFLQQMETNDFKYNKEGLQFTQSQMESNKKLS